MSRIDDTFRSVVSEGTAETRVRGSRFIAVASYAGTEAAATAAVEEARKNWHDARHHCYAFRVGACGLLARSNDDGEPGGTAGAPILQQLESRDLTDTVVVVTRYFGGTKLGRGGLVRAYSEAAGLALDAAGVTEHIIARRFRIEFPYDDTARALRTVEVFGGSVVASEYSDVAAYLVEIRLSERDAFRERFTEQLAGRGTIRDVTEEDSD